MTPQYNQKVRELMDSRNMADGTILESEFLTNNKSTSQLNSRDLRIDSSVGNLRSGFKPDNLGPTNLPDTFSQLNIGVFNP